MRTIVLCLTPLVLTACSIDTPVMPTSTGTSSFSAAQRQESTVSPITAQTASARTIVRSVTGTAVRSLPNPDAHGWRSFTINALERQDGSVSGRFEMHLRQLPVRIHGRITCAGTQGNSAWLGGVIELIVGSFPGGAEIGPGTPIRIRMVDNGEGSDAPPDLISGLGTFAGASEGVELAYCATKPNQPILTPVDAGNIQIRG